ncbi:MAG: hypothetical protein IJ636_04520 [Bacteroidales bacterium]|nr:hypothetical protein [Bacteroidales bacterium]
MKKIALVSLIACLGLFAVSCKSEQKAETAPAEEAVKEAVETVTEVSEEAVQTVNDALKEAAEEIQK